MPGTRRDPRSYIELGPHDTPVCTGLVSQPPERCPVHPVSRYGDLCDSNSQAALTAARLVRAKDLTEAEHASLVQAVYTRFAADIELAQSKKDRELAHLVKVREDRLAALPAQVIEHPEWF
jgi:hypothetical protein